MTTYRFDRQLARGAEGEAQLDDHFAQWFRILPVSLADQRRGIDRVFVDDKAGKVFSVEYKTDRRASQTGNAFIETVSQESATRRVAGWAYTCQADYLVYYCPEPDVIYVLRPAVLKSAAQTWAARYPLRDIPNDGYVTRGVLVPLWELEKIAVKVY